jgi:hypothetical protein
MEVLVWDSYNSGAGLNQLNDIPILPALYVDLQQQNNKINPLALPIKHIKYGRHDNNIIRNKGQ